MPQPLPNIGIQLHGAAHVALHDQPDCVKGIGAVAIAWTKVEASLVAMLSDIFGTVTRTYMPGTLYSATVQPSHLAAAAISESETIRVRMKILNAALMPIIAGTHHEEIWKTLERKINSLAKKRNQIVHGNWRASDQIAEGLILFDKSNDSAKARVWSAKDFEFVFNEMYMLENEIYIFEDGVVKGMAAGTVSTKGTLQPENSEKR